MVTVHREGRWTAMIPLLRIELHSTENLLYTQQFLSVVETRPKIDNPIGIFK